MRILITDTSAEGQSLIARIVENLDAVDQDILDISLFLASQEEVLNKVPECDVLIIGPGAEESAPLLAREVKDKAPDVEIIMYVGDKAYSGGAFRAAQVSRVRKVLPIGASPLDLLQELISIHEQFRSSGKTKKGKLLVVLQAKGGIGATSLTAGLGELSAMARQATTLWDLDIESNDLCRAVGAKGNQAHVVNSWLHEKTEITRESVKAALFKVSPFLSVLPPPSDLPAAMDLVGHPDALAIGQRVKELLKILQDRIIVDSGGRLGPVAGMLARSADRVVVLVDDSLLGISAAHAFLESLLPLLKNNPGTLRIVCTGTKLPHKELVKLITQDQTIPQASWDMPIVPYDPEIEGWAGSGKTMLSMGQISTKRALYSIANSLDLISAEKRLEFEAAYENIEKSKSGLFSRLFYSNVRSRMIFSRAVE